MADKKIINVFILDNEGIDGIMDGMGYEEKYPQVHSLACVYEDNPAIGTKLLPPGEDGVLHAEDLEKAIEAYGKKDEPSPEDVKADIMSGMSNKDLKDKYGLKAAEVKALKGSYETKVMTPSK